MRRKRGLPAPPPHGHLGSLPQQQPQPSLHPQPQLLLQPQPQLLPQPQPQLLPQPQPQLLPQPPQLPPPQQQQMMMMIRMIHRQPPPPQPLLPQHMLCFTSLASSGSYYVDRVGVVPADRILFSICGNGRLISPAPCSFS